MHIGREGVEDKTKKTRRWRAVVVRWERSEVEENERDFTLHTKLQQWKKNRKYCGKKVMAWFWLQYKNSSIAALIEGELNWM